MESGNRTDNMERRIAPDGMTEDGKKESEAIDRRVEELILEEGNEEYVGLSHVQGLDLDP